MEIREIKAAIKSAHSKGTLIDTYVDAKDLRKLIEYVEELEKRNEALQDALSLWKSVQMIRVMKSHHENGNGYWGLEFFRRWFVGLDYYPSSWQYSLSIARVRE